MPVSESLEEYLAKQGFYLAVRIAVSESVLFSH